jgi:hypothetical protein
MPHLAEQAFHAEGARLVGHDGHDELRPMSLSFSSLVNRMRTKAMVVEISRSPVPFVELLEARPAARPGRSASMRRLGTIAAQGARRARRYFISGLSSAGR